MLTDLQQEVAQRLPGLELAGEPVPRLGLGQNRMTVVAAHRVVAGAAHGQGLGGLHRCVGPRANAVEGG